MSVSILRPTMRGSLFPDFRAGLKLGYTDDDTLAVTAGAAELGGNLYTFAATSVTFANLDTGSRALGRDYAVFATPDGLILSLIPVDNSSTGVLVPSGYTAATARLLGYFHNGPKADGTVGASRNQAIFEYSVTSNDLLNESYPYRAHADLAAGIPLPGMVRVGGIAIGIYQASRQDATVSAAGSSAYPTSRYGVVPWASVRGWDTMAALAGAGCKMPTWVEWLTAVEFNPGSSTPARLNGNTNSGPSSDDATQAGIADPTQAGRTLTGTGPRTTNNGATATGRSWYSPAGLADPVGNVWEWVAQVFGGLKTTSPGTSVAWGHESDLAYNFEGQSYNPDTGGWTSGLPALLGVGGYWNSGVSAGVRAAHADRSPGYSYTVLGFRSAR